MKKLLVAAVALVLLLGANAAFAFPLSGYVTCEGNGEPMAGIVISVVATDDVVFSATATTDANGYYFIHLPGEQFGCFRATAATAAGDYVVVPAGGYYDFCTVYGTWDYFCDWVIYSPSCVEEAQKGCWLTGGGAYFVEVPDALPDDPGHTKVGKEFNWGGVVNPGCNPSPSDGGQWNTIDEQQELHFQGFEIVVVRCGNVDGIPAGSTSPVTPFNFIEFQGTGRVQGIRGNKADYPAVYFFGRAEDRNEPGSTGPHEGEGVDRYFMNVYTDEADPVGSSIMLVDLDGNPATVDPVLISEGNMQLHSTGCEEYETVALEASLATFQAAIAVPAAVEFAVPRPNPVASQTTLRFALPREARVSLSVFDVGGRLVRELAAGTAGPGAHSLTWNLLDRDGQRVSNGVFFARLAVDGQIHTQAMVVAR